MNQIDVDIEQTTQEIFANIETQLGTIWGAITGNIESQTDLMTALNGKLDKTGGTIDGMTTMFVTSTPYSQKTVLRLGAKLENQTEPSTYVSINASPNSNALYTSASLFIQNVIPGWNNGTLGISTNNWQAIYVKNICRWDSGVGTTTITVPQTSGTMVVATPPEDEYNYVLKSVIEDGVRVVKWVKES